MRIKNKTVVIGAIVAAILALSTLLFFSMSSTSDAPAQKHTALQKQALGQTQSADHSNFVRFHSPRFGNTSSRVTVVEWLDPECEGCRAIHPSFERIMSEYSNQVQFVIRYMPFHRNSMYAATALEEARELGKFKEALDLIFEKQPEWGSHRAPRPDLIPVYLSQLGIPKEKLESAYLLQKHGAKIRLDEEDGLKVGVRATPSFFVNGQPLAELGEQQLRAAIVKALRETQ